MSVTRRAEDSPQDLTTVKVTDDLTGLVWAERWMRNWSTLQYERRTSVYSVLKELGCKEKETNGVARGEQALELSSEGESTFLDADGVSIRMRSSDKEKGKDSPAVLG